MNICKISSCCLIIAILAVSGCCTISPRAANDCGRHLYRELDEYYRWNYGYPKDNSEFYSWLEDKQFAFDICTGKDSISASRHLSDIKQKSTEKARVPLSGKQDVSDYERLLLFLSKYEIELVGDSNRITMNSDRYRYHETMEYQAEEDFTEAVPRSYYPILCIGHNGEKFYVTDESRTGFYRQIDDVVGELTDKHPKSYTIIRYNNDIGMRDYLNKYSFQDIISNKISRFLYDYCSQHEIQQMTFPVCLWPEAVQ